MQSPLTGTWKLYNVVTPVILSGCILTVGHMKRQVGSFDGLNYIWYLVCGFTVGEEGCDRLLHALVLLQEQVHLNMCKFLCRILSCFLVQLEVLIFDLQCWTHLVLWILPWSCYLFV